MNRKLGRLARATAMATTIGLAGGAETASSYELCAAYDDYKVDVPMWFDKHGHTGLFPPPTTDEWEFVEQVSKSRSEYHNSFRDNGYASEEHVACEGGGDGPAN